MVRATKLLDDAIAANYPSAEKATKVKGRWGDIELFKDPERTKMFSPDYVNMSPAWFENGHEVGHYFVLLMQC